MKDIDIVFSCLKEYNYRLWDEDKLEECKRLLKDMSMEELRIVRHSRWMNKDNALYPALFELLFKEELQVVVNKLNETSTMDLVLEYKTTKSSFKKEKISVILLERYDSMKDEERKNAFKILLRKGLITKDNK